MTKVQILGLLLTFCLPSAAVTTNADGDNIVVKTKDGNSNFPLSQTTKIEFGNDGLTFYTAGNATTGKKFQYDEIEHITFENQTNGIATTETQRGTLKMRSVNGGKAIAVEGMKGSETVDIYSIDGSSQMKKAGFDGGLIDVSRLVPGVYILKIGNQTVKFNKK